MEGNQLPTLSAKQPTEVFCDLLHHNYIIGFMGIVGKFK